MKRHVIVIGGGASGLVAAITAARNGAQVTIIEQKDRVGKKILSTGNGKCNLTNKNMNSSCFYGDDTAIVSTVLEKFGFEDTMNFFEDLGVILKDRQGYVYPISDQATTILDVLRMEVERCHIHVLCEQRAEKITRTKKDFLVTTNQTCLSCDAIILATGGKAAPALGSDGSGYHLAKSMGHRLSPVVPALVQLRGKDAFFKQVAGVRTQAKVSVLIDGTYQLSDTGELQLTDYGISGIPVFQISRVVAKALYEKKTVSVEIDFLPSMDEKTFEMFLIERTQKHGYKSAEEFLVGIFPKKIIGLLLKESNIPFSLEFHKLRPEQYENLIQKAKHFCVSIIGTNDFAQAQVCAGGIKTTEVNPETMESVYEKDFYLVGELLDIDGICGGYNLQWAWSTGYIAGLHAAKGL